MNRPISRKMKTINSRTAPTTASGLCCTMPTTNNTMSPPMAANKTSRARMPDTAVRGISRIMACSNVISDRYPNAILPATPITLTVDCNKRIRPFCEQSAASRRSHPRHRSGLGGDRVRLCVAQRRRDGHNRTPRASRHGEFAVDGVRARRLPRRLRGRSHAAEGPDGFLRTSEDLARRSNDCRHLGARCRLGSRPVLPSSTLALGASG